MIEFIKSHLTVSLLILSLIVITPFVIYYVITAKREHPKGLIAAALSNMGERFGYYIMNAVLAPEPIFYHPLDRRDLPWFSR